MFSTPLSTPRLPVQFKIPIRLLQATWILLVTIYVLFFLFSIQPMYASFRADAAALFLDALPSIGMTVDSYAAFFLILNSVYIIAAVTIGFIIISRRADDWLAMVVTLTIIALNVLFGRSAIAIAGAYPEYVLSVTILRWLTAVLALWVLLVFPTGMFVPRWAIWILPPFTFLAALAVDVRRYLGSSVTSPAAIAMTGLLLAGVILQIYRYLRYSTSAQRQQTKWVLFGFILGIVPLLTFVVLDILVTPYLLGDPLLRMVYRFLTNTFLIFLPLVALPISFGIAITRSRLWDIDLLINRSLSVALVTVVLGAVFILLVLVIQVLLGSVLSGVPFIVGTLGVGVMYSPTRRHVQHLIDRRFYRWRFDLIQLAEAEHKAIAAQSGVWTGHLLGGYTVERLLGRGGMGEVYLASKDGRKYALKTVIDIQSNDQVERLKREAEALSKLSHPNIVGFVDSGEDIFPYFVMEFVEGVSLSTYLKQRGTLTPAAARAVLNSVADALDYMHRNGVIHRDLKPSNILLKLDIDNGTMTPVLLDFGLAKIEDDSSLTGSHAIGTIYYMSPEQILAAKAITYRTDIYTLAVICFEMLTGKVPFQGTLGQVLFAHVQQPVPDPRSITPDIPTGFADAIMGAMSKDATSRPESAFAFVTSLH